MSSVVKSVLYDPSGCIVIIDTGCPFRLNEVLEFTNPSGKVIITAVLAIDRVNIFLHEGYDPEKDRLLFAVHSGDIEPGATVRSLSPETY